MKLGEIFRDSMIMQAGKPVRVFGSGEGDVKIEFLGETREISADGKWTLDLGAHPYGGPYEMKVTLNGETTVIRDIMIGEVILFSGQSNIQFRMSEEITPPEQYADDPMLRIFVSERLEKGEPFTPADGWIKCAKETVKNWSAVAYLTGLEARRAGIPAVGVIACSQGASVIQSWINEEIFNKSDLVLPPEVLHHDHSISQYTVWNKPGTLYRFMLERLLPYSFGNVVWYQGESNASVAEGKIYAKLLGMMIRNWREADNDAELPFYVVQIADFAEHEGWRLVQQAQLDAQNELENVHTVICADICEKKMIHPVTKWKLAKRIFDAMRDNKTI